ncbi:aminotransferase class V-fold PLP-dependent enzyme [Acidaminobacter sp. JC074]|uniref:aminotransferase class V-fold PLP-dependent enzyme n=1 Tax=Acidaminobacter sp. JC074 TaxID=2530199 RepID=UPI001F0D537A|nr:aminotransferase class V-fold PLP-dependent enzyme [Acidaminobacter sp. JC074]MCH4887203.1 aminotransferase class V-fold PLP-dependent enzyme [Acidaminobacter sp. JC074]
MKEFNIDKIREDFPALKEYVYLNSSSISIMPLPVQESLKAFMNKIAYAGTVSFDEEAEIASVENTRSASARLFNCSEENIAITSSATEGLCQIAWALKPKGNIIVVDIEFPSGVTPWRRVAMETGAEIRFVNVKDKPADLFIDQIRDLMDEETSVVCVGHAQYSNGVRFDLKELAGLCHDNNTKCIIDATQSAGVVPIDVMDTDVDALVAGGYKWLCGPFGAAIVYIRESLKNEIEPVFVGWRSMKNPYIFDATRYEYNDGLRGYEYSTMSYSAGYALGESINYIMDLGIENIFKQAILVANYLMEKLDEMGLEILSPREESRRTGSVLVRFPGLDGEEVAKELTKRNVIVSPRFNATRFSCHFFNNYDDIDKAVAVLKDILEEMR